jgi:hypothetical protein
MSILSFRSVPGILIEVISYILFKKILAQIDLLNTPFPLLIELVKLSIGLKY